MAFDSKTPLEARLLTFDFSTKAPASGTLSNEAVTAVAILSGPGATDDLTIGSPTVVDLTVTVLVSAGTDGTKYRLRCEVDCSNGEHFEIDRDLPVAARSALIS